MYYLDVSDEELLEFPRAQQWKEEARRHWEKYLPNMCRELKAQGKFEESLNNAVVNALRVRDRYYLALKQQPHIQNEKDILKKAGLLYMSDLIAQEFAKNEYLFLPPEKEEEEEE